MTIYEPATLITDYLLALLAAWCGWRLGRHANPSQRWWSRALFLTAGSAVIGGTHHGFGPLLGEGLSVVLWRVALLCIGLTSAAMSLAFVEELAPPARRLLWQRIVWIKFAGFAALGLAFPVFLVAIADYGLVMFALVYGTVNSTFDLDLDGGVDFGDFIIFALAYGRKCM